MPQGRQALGLGLVIAAGLLYVSAGFAIQVITKSGVSAFLVSYISTCLFVLHFPCAAFVRWCGNTSLVRALRGERIVCRFDSAIPEYPPKDKLSDEGGSPEGGSSQHWEEVTAAETEIGKGGDSELQGSAQGAKRLEWAAISDVGCDERDQSSSELQKAGLPQGSEESSASSGNRGASESQDPILSVLDERKADPVPGKLVELTPGQVATRGEGQADDIVLTEKQKLEIVDRMLEAQHRSQCERGLAGALEAARFDGRLWPELRGGAYVGLGGAKKLGPFTVGPFTLGPFTLCAEHLEAVKIAATVGPLWFLAQYTYTLSLTLTTVTSNTILFSCTSLFTFLVSVIWLKEPFTFVKLGMIACAIVGTAVVSVSDAKSAANGSGHSASGAALGNALTLVAALVYAFYGTCMKYMNPEGEDGSLSPSSKPVSNPVSTSLVFGYMGLLWGLVLLPWLVLLHWIGVESLQWMGARTFGLLIVKALFGNVLADYLCARAMLLTSPTAASVGLAFQTPVAIVADLVIFGIVPKPLMLVGGVLVMWGFLGINLFDQGQPKAPISEV